MRYNDFEGLKISAPRLWHDAPAYGRFRSLDYDEGERMVAEAMKGGITYFDTAYRYHEGQSEVFCGKVISKYPRETFMLADKLPTWLCSTREDAEKIFAEQLEKCNVDYFDFYLLHNVDEESWPNIEKLDLVGFVAEKKAGRKSPSHRSFCPLRAGAAGHGTGQIQPCAGICPDTAQLFRLGTSERQGLI